MTLQRDRNSQQVIATVEDAYKNNNAKQVSHDLAFKEQRELLFEAIANDVPPCRTTKDFPDDATLIRRGHIR